MLLTGKTKSNYTEDLTAPAKGFQITIWMMESNCPHATREWALSQLPDRKHPLISIAIKNTPAF